MKRQLAIGSQLISDDSACFVIAEIGHNHQGSLEKAKELFRTAKECGADAVKLQKRDNRRLYTRSMYETPYVHENSFGPTYGAHREALEFGREEYRELKRYAAELGIAMFATAFDFSSADFLAEMDFPAFKIASGDLKTIPLIQYVAKFGKPVIVSTGGGSMSDVQRVYDAVMPINPQLCLLQCTASYPVEPEQMNLNVITTYRERFPETVIGLSDHQNGIAMAMIGYALGARVIEKHFTLNRAWKGTDHAFSLEPIGLKKLVRDLQRARTALGNGIKEVYPNERAPLYKMGKKLVASRDLPAGYTLKAEDIAIKSPNDGTPPHEIDRFIGQVLVRPLKSDENIVIEDVASAKEWSLRQNAVRSVA